MSSFGSGGDGAADKAGAEQPDRPTPKRVSARPVATWLAASVSVSSAKSAASAAPAGTPRRTPSEWLPVASCAGEAADRAHQHHALDAEIEHAGALDDEFAERREQQRRRAGAAS